MFIVVALLSPPNTSGTLQFILFDMVLSRFGYCIFIRRMVSRALRSIPMLANLPTNVLLVQGNSLQKDHHLQAEF